MTELPHQPIQELIQAAREVAARAYAPYSGFRVGAALRAASGRIYPGCNVENVSLGLTICAERVAVGCAVAAGERRFLALAIHADADPPPPPCGACRQVLREFAADLPIYLVGPGDAWREESLAALYPLPFAPPIPGEET